MTGHSTIDESDEEDPKNSKVDESLIKVGDSLKVKYGRGRQIKVYEAKILKIEVDPVKNKKKYFVHYSGWNSRYDEWIKKGRITALVRDRSPRRRSGKLKNKGETLQDAPTGGPNSQSQSSVIPALSSQNSVSSVNSNDESSRHSSQSQPAKRGRPPNSGKGGSAKDILKEESKCQPSQEKQSQLSPHSTPVSDSKGGRRGRPPLSSKKEKLTRSKSITDDQSTNDSFATSSLADDSMSKTDDKKSNANLSSDNEISDRNDDKDTSEDMIIEKKTVQPPELHDENTVENRLHYEEPIRSPLIPLALKTEPVVEQSVIKSVVSDVIEAVPRTSEPREASPDKEEAKRAPVKDAFDFVDEEMAKEEEPLKEQLKKKRKSKDDGKKATKSVPQSEKTEKSKEICNEDNEVKGHGRSNSFSRKSVKKARKSTAETVPDKTEEQAKEMPVLTEEIPLPQPQKETPAKAEEPEIKSSLKSKTETKSPHSSGDSPPQREPKHKRKGRKRKEDETPTHLKKKVKPSKLELHEEDSNYEVQKLFESCSSSTPPQESDASPSEEVKHLPNFTNDINPSQQESVDSEFLLCEEAVPASPEKVPQPDEQMDDSLPLHESPHSYHSSPTQSPQDNSGNKEAKGSGGSNSEMENEPIVSAKEESNKMESYPSPTHDEDSLISRPDCSKSPISPKKRRRGRVRTISQSDGSHPKERIGCKTRGSSGRIRAERHSPLTALEHRMPFSLTPISFHNFVPESKYNFCKPLDESIDADRRINILQERLQELRKTYMNIKQEVAILDRKKKKARRKEKEREKKEMSNCNGRHNPIPSNSNITDPNANHRVGAAVASVSQSSPTATT